MTNCCRCRVDGAETKYLKVTVLMSTQVRTGWQRTDRLRIESDADRSKFFYDRLLTKRRVAAVFSNRFVTQSVAPQNLVWLTSALSMR